MLWNSAVISPEDHRALKSWRLELRRRSSGRHSEILEFESLGRWPGVVVKRISDHVPPEEAEAVVVREFESLQALRTQLPPQLLGTVPKPLMVLRTSTALVLEALSGRPLNIILKREANTLVGPLRRTRMLCLGQLAGRWLKALHEATSRKTSLHDSAEFLALLDSRLGRCRAAGMSDHLITATRQVLSEASHRIEGQPLAAAARQGDSIPQNILVDGNQLRVVDFENFCQSDSIYQDIATFVAYVQALSAVPYYSHRALHKLGQGFLHAYGVAGNEFPLRLYLARAIVWLISELTIEKAVTYTQRRLRLLQGQLESVCAELQYD
jgi:hypothetical protein